MRILPVIATALLALAAMPTVSADAITYCAQGSQQCVCVYNGNGGFGCTDVGSGKTNCAVAYGSSNNSYTGYVCPDGNIGGNLQDAVDKVICLISDIDQRSAC